MVECAAAGCENQVSDMSSTGFCFTCLGDLQRDMNELSEELDKTLRLEAEFVAYCDENGLPHPHEK